MENLEKMANDILSKFDEKLKAQTENFLTEKDLATVKNDFESAIKSMDIEGLKKYGELIESLKKEVKDLTELSKEVKTIAEKQGIEIKSLKSNKIDPIRKKMNRREQVKYLVTAGLSSDEFDKFQRGGYKGHTDKMIIGGDTHPELQYNSETKAVVPITNHTGTVMISEISDIIRDDAPIRMEHVRDLLSVGMTEQAQIVGGQVYDFTDALTYGALMLAENTAASETVFKSKENTWGLKRIANSMRISKRYFKTNGLKWVVDYVLARLPDATLTVEDFQLLFGDGVGNDVSGLQKAAQDFDLTPNTYTAGAFTSVATWDAGAQALITFTAAHGMTNGDSLTIANATETTYNATHTAVQVVNATQVIIDLAYVAEADTSAWTGVSTSIFYQAVESAQEYDVLSVAESLLQIENHSATGHVVNPQQKTKMGLLKDANNNYLNINKDLNGQATSVNGLPIIGTPAMPAGKFMSGDFSRRGAELKEYTPLNIQFVEDVITVKSNEIVVVIEEEIIFPIYNPFTFIYGKFSSAITELETTS